MRYTTEQMRAYAGPPPESGDFGVKTAVREAADEIDRLTAWQKAASEAANTILAPMTMEFGRLMVEAPDETITINAYGETIEIPASKFMALYRATDI